MRRLLPPIGAVTACIACTACQPQGPLFPGMEAPTQAQAQSMGWPAPQYFDLDEGDNQDPSVDNAAYPYDGSNWYLQPGYLQG